MILISRKYLCVYSGDGERQEIDLETLRQMVTEKPAHVVYFETAERLYGIVSFGDIMRSDGRTVRINREFISFGRAEYMGAREVFRKVPIICEIPVVEDGKLVGEYHRFDDELILDRARDPKYNAYAQEYFRDLPHAALVRPNPFRDHKTRYYQMAKDLLDRYGADYTELSFDEMLVSLDRFETFIMTDEQEKRGAFLSLYLHGQNDTVHYKFLTLRGMLEKLESSEVVDYDDVFGRLYERGAEIILLTEKDLERDYVRRTRTELRKRFPRVENNLNKLIAPTKKSSLTISPTSAITWTISRSTISSSRRTSRTFGSGTFRANTSTSRTVNGRPSDSLRSTPAPSSFSGRVW